MWLNRNWIIAGLLAAMLLVIPEALGKRATTGLHVRAGVSPYLYYRVLHEQHSLFITKANKLSGYKDVSVGTVVKVRTNDPNGYVLSVNSQEDSFFTSAVVREGGNSFPFSPGEAVEIHEPYQGPGPDVKRLSYRFYLGPETETGLYSWPIIVSAHPV